ncbi:cyclase family protein [Clostridium hydrogeniformans]|uniref:cyclase family protein n=1 Tax=Clostridium hydrogeniformans TaxID=349933 RepID=UPI000489BA0B|nr:cyclase family protein [Clostridium hydrogeniformans]
MIDITLELKKDNKIWNGVGEDKDRLLKLGHIGTHIDVCNKSKVPLDYFKTRGILVDCSNYKENEEIGIEALEGIKIDEAEFIIFKTNIQEKYEYGSEGYIKDHCYLSWKVLDYLLDKKVAFIGIDCAGVRKGKEHFEADVKAEKNNTYIIENLSLNTLKCKKGDKFNVYTMWIENPFSTGLSTRVLVDID